jgi:undecaprenyl-diphosphatase
MKRAIEGLLPLERDLFFALNGSDSVFLDNVMWTLSGRFVWIPLFLFIIFILFYKTPLKLGLLVTFILILVFVASDQVSSSLFKPLFERFRPTHHPDFMNQVDIINGYRGGRFGFISGHATNSFGLTVFLSLLFKYRWFTAIALFWATLNSYTRIYLGVHFISDIIAGIIVGSLLAIIFYSVLILVKKPLLKTTSEISNKVIYSSNNGKILSIFILIYIIMLVCFSSLLSTLPH